MLPIINKILRKDKERNGKCPVILQIYYKKERKQVFTGLYIPPEFWDKDKCEATKKYHDHLWFNQVLKNKYQETEQIFTKQLIDSGTVAIKNTVKVSRLSFFEYAANLFDSKGNTCSQDYIDRSKAAMEDFKEFAGNLNFQSITPQVLKAYEDHLFKKGNQRNTVNRKFKRIKEVFTEAIKQGITDQNPFNSFQPVTYKQSKRGFLTMDEVSRIEAAQLIGGLDLVRNYFLLSCYTGLRFGDLRKFNKEKFIIVNNGVERIIIGTSKTGSVISIKLSEKVKAIINKIDAPIYTNTHSNRLLKLICEITGIERNISWHQSRHSAAVNMASAGLPIEVVSRILGHSNIKTTAIYYKITDTKLDEAMDKFYEKYS